MKSEHFGKNLSAAVRNMQARPREDLRAEAKRLLRRFDSGCIGVAAAALHLLLFGDPQASGQDEQRARVTSDAASGSDLTKASLEELMNMEVISVSKKEQRISKVPAAIFVITQEDIARSGARNIPDLLRMVPGVDVAHLDANIWAISIRGFADRFADKVLVLIDGRSVYTPTSSGVYWDQLDVPLEDIERIEVIRGPGGTVWGANAVNGVINILTKEAGATIGGVISVGAGSSENTEELAQYGGTISKESAYRIFVKHFNVGNLTATDKTEAADGWHMVRGGFRTDWGMSQRDTLSLQGDFAGTSAGETLNVVLANALPQQLTFNSRTRSDAGDVQAHWNRNLSSGSDLSLQAYYDGYNRFEEGGAENRRTFALDFQHHWAIHRRHDVVWGLGYRTTSDELTPKFSKSFVPPEKTDNLFSGFAQDEIQLSRLVWFTLGSKFEHNSYTGFEFEPSAQLVWTATRDQTLWLSAARAIREPARADTAIRIDTTIVPLDNGGFGVGEIIANPERKAEELLAYQAGYRGQVTKSISFDLATFLNFYHHLQTDEPGTPFFTSSPGPPHTVFPQTSDDLAHGRTYGAEIFGRWDITSHWRIVSGFTSLRMHVAADASSQDAAVGSLAGDVPNHKFEIRSLVTLPKHTQWDTTLYDVDALPDQGVGGYARLDTRLGWRIGESTECSVIGQNLLTPRHAEFGDDTPLHTLMRRSVFVQVRWWFAK